MTLRVDNLSAERGGRVVIDCVSFALDPGQAIILRGPNGSGKTTLLRTLAGLQPPLDGTIDCDSDTIAYAGHLDGLKATLSVAENLRFWASLFGQGGTDAAHAAFDLTGLAHRQARNLSAGQKRRLGLARLLVTGRPIWLLDEPTVSLDTASTRLFARVIGDHLATGGIAVMATHVDLGLDAASLDMTAFSPKTESCGPFDEALS